jgi:hypothetical protein
MVFGKQSLIAPPDVSTVQSAPPVSGTHKLTLYFRHVTVDIWTQGFLALLHENVCQQPIRAALEAHLILAFRREAWRHFLTLIPSSRGREECGPRNGATVSRLFKESLPRINNSRLFNDSLPRINKIISKRMKFTYKWLHQTKSRTK